MKKTILSCLCIILLSAGARAQFTYGPELGFNICNYSIKNPGFISPSTAWVPGVHICGIADYSINDNISLQPGLFFAINGIKYSYSFILYSFDFSAHINTIHIPINIIYKAGDPGGNRFFFGAGPFAGINLGGSAKISSSAVGFFPGTLFDSSYTLKIGSDRSDDIKRFDFGVDIDAGYQMASGLFFRAHFQKGFLNLVPQGDASNSIKSMSFGISVGYLFGEKTAKKDKNKKPVRKLK